MKKSLKVVLIIFTLIIILGVCTSIVDNKRINENKEPLFTIKIKDGEIGKITYIGIGYKIVGYFGISINEPFDHNVGVKFGSWFMKYEKPKEEKEKLPVEIHSFFGRVVESNSKYIIVEPNENEEERKISDKFHIDLNKNDNIIYEIGTNVKITYSGDINEIYPVQVKTEKIEIKSVEDFELIYYQKTMIQPKQKEIIVSKDEIQGIDYNVYAFEGHIAINLNDNKELSEDSITLREALLQNKITMYEIIEKANKDIPDAVGYDDGGSVEYHYNNYTIIKLNKLDGNRDVYIGSKDLTLYDIEQ